MSISAEKRQNRSDRIMSRANDFMSGNADRKSTEKPNITESALIVIPRPVVRIAV